MATNQCLAIKARSALSPLLLLLLMMMVALQIDPSRAIRLIKSRKDSMKLLGGVTVDSQQFFSHCDMSSNSASCGLAMDEHFLMEYTQCAYTFNENVPWWRGYLENPLFVTNVYIQNADWLFMGDVDGLLEFNIIGNDYTCYTHSGNVSFDSMTFPCDILASYIEIRSTIRRSMITLCEVQVYGAMIKLMSPNKPPVRVEFYDCDMSSSVDMRECWLAVDGYTGGSAERNQCADTMMDTNPWFWATFKIPYLVQMVRLYNQADCCKERLTVFEIRVSGALCANHNLEHFTYKDFNCNLFGDRVLVQRLTQNLDYLTICEVEVYGFPVEMQTGEGKRVLQGCFKDDPFEPDLSDGPVSTTHMHTAKCDKMCRRLGKQYFGLQAGTECWCGDNHGKYGASSNGTNGCSMKCEGRPNEICGHTLTNLVYKLLY